MFSPGAEGLATSLEQPCYLQAGENGEPGPLFIPGALSNFWATVTVK